MVVGEGERFPAALIVPSFPGLRNWCQVKGIEYSTDAETIRNAEVIGKFQREIDKYNENFAQFEKIKQFRLLPELWSIESGELTPTLKLKRKEIMRKNGDLVREIYRETAEQNH